MVEILIEKLQEAHGILAYYTFRPPGVFEATMDCSCGFKIIAHSWEDAGAAMDAHLERVLENT